MEINYRKLILRNDGIKPNYITDPNIKQVRYYFSKEYSEMVLSISNDDIWIDYMFKYDKDNNKIKLNTTYYDYRNRKLELLFNDGFKMKTLFIFG